MADIRINALATTAASTASDDFIAVDGSANGTRKLNAYSPTFGGNLTVSGGTVDITSASSAKISGSTAGSSGTLSLISNTAGNYRSLQFGYGSTPTYLWKIGYQGATSNDQLNFESGTGTVAQLTQAGALTLSSNLTVSGGTITGGTSGLSLASGGTNQNITLTPSGTGVINSAFGSNLKLRTSLGTTNVGTARIGVWYNGYVSNADYAAIELAAAGASGGDIRFFTIQSGSTLSQKAMLAENGNFLVGTTTDAASGARLQAQLTGTDGTVSTLLSLRKNTNAAGTGVAIDFVPDSTDNPLAKLSAVRTSLVSGYTDFRFSTWNGSAFSEQLRLVGQTGNLLLKTDGIDSSNGKLQLATHTSSAGGIGFGTGLSLFTSSASVLDLSVASGNPTLRFLNGTTVRGGIGTSGTTLSVQSDGGSIILASNSTTALTLDSSQNATFAGTGTFNKFLSVNFGADNCFFTGNPGQAIFIRTALDATSGNQTRNSPSAFFRGAYWDGAATANIDASIKVTASTTVANNSLDFGFTTGGGTQSLRIFQSGDATFAGRVGIGGASVAASSLILRGASLTSGTTQLGLDQQTTFSSGATNAGRGVSSIVVTAAASFTMANGAAFYALTPIVGAGSAITTSSGFYVANQGGTGITNAYGIDIAAQSGASTVNVGLRNLGATILATPATAVTLNDNSSMTFELTSNTSLTIKVRGTDGTTRSVALTLA